ncbi:MAG: hypothetical protein NTY14_08595 [Candidatus Omnitrophica bacterium]|nr:hypothetical protein [Candidatus Omnitrophota bacterium]
MVKKSVLWGGVIVCVFAVMAVAEAQVAKAKVRLEHADRNDDGVVDKKEIRMEKKWEQRRIDKDHDLVPDKLENKARVNTALEQKYDANQDGVLERAEAKQMIKDRYELIKTQGKAKVDTAIEAQYDANNDGVLDATEAAAMNAANQ